MTEILPVAQATQPKAIQPQAEEKPLDNKPSFIYRAKENVVWMWNATVAKLESVGSYLKGLALRVVEAVRSCFGKKTESKPDTSVNSVEASNPVEQQASQAPAPAPSDPDDAMPALEVGKDPAPQAAEPPAPQPVAQAPTPQPVAQAPTPQPVAQAPTPEPEETPAPQPASELSATPAHSAPEKPAEEPKGWLPWLLGR